MSTVTKPPTRTAAERKFYQLSVTQEAAGFDPKTTVFDDVEAYEVIPKTPDPLQRFGHRMTVWFNTGQSLEVLDNVTTWRYLDPARFWIDQLQIGQGLHWAELQKLRDQVTTLEQIVHGISPVLRTVDALRKEVEELKHPPAPKKRRLVMLGPSTASQRAPSPTGV